MTTRAEYLARSLKDYRKAARMPQWVLAELLQLEQSVIADMEAAREVEADIEQAVRGYLASAPRPRKLRALKDGQPAEHHNIYLTEKLLLWATKTNMSTEGLEAMKALKSAYEVAKRDFGLASIPLVQLEVENALTLATRGRYKAMTRPSREMRPMAEKEPMHVSQMSATQLLRLQTWFHAKGQDMVTEMMKTAGSLTPEQERVANGEAPDG